MSTDLTLVATATDGTLTTTSLIVAHGTETQHKNVMELVRNNLSDFEQFGRVAFETRPFETAGGTQHREVAVLREEHATLLLTYMRNSDVVKRFKIALVKAFFELRNRVMAAVPQTLPEALRAYAREVEAREAAESYVAELQPKADYVDQFVSPDDCLLFRTFASQINVGEKAIRELLVERRRQSHVRRPRPRCRPRSRRPHRPQRFRR